MKNTLLRAGRLWVASGVLFALCSAGIASAQQGRDHHATSRAGGVSAPVADAALPRAAVGAEDIEPVSWDEGAVIDGAPGCCDVVTPGCGDVCAPAPCVVPCGVWFRGEYLGWSIDQVDTPALVSTTSPTPALADAGVLGTAGTSVLLGDGPLLDDSHDGYRLSGGLALHHGLGLQASYFGVEGDGVEFMVDGDAFEVLARPFENVEPGSEGEGSVVINFPVLLEGAVAVRADSSFEGVEVLMSRDVVAKPDGCCQMLFGWRNLRLEESLAIDDFREVVATGTALVVGTTLDENDWFDARTDFNGGVIGVSGSRCHGWVTWEGSLKLALGSSSSRVSIRGQTVTNVPDGMSGFTTTTTDSGLLAQGTNSGVYERSDFAVAPEIQLGARFKLTPRMSFVAGYNLLYLSRVARVGSHIDRQLNLSQLDPGGLDGVAAPTFEWRLEDLLAQGVNLGLDLRY